MPRIKPRIKVQVHGRHADYEPLALPLGAPRSGLELEDVKIPFPLYTFLSKNVKMWRNRNPRSLWVAMWNDADALENSLVAPQRVKEWPYDPAVPLLRVCPWERNACPHALLYTNAQAAVFLRARVGKWLQRPSTDDQLDRMWYIHGVGIIQPYKGKESWYIYNMDEPWKYAKSKQVSPRGPHIIEIYMKCPQQTNL